MFGLRLDSIYFFPIIIIFSSVPHRALALASLVGLFAFFLPSFITSLFKQFSSILEMTSHSKMKESPLSSLVVAKMVFLACLARSLIAFFDLVKNHSIDFGTMQLSGRMAESRILPRPNRQKKVVIMVPAYFNNTHR